jgi:hypothetical protein
VARSADRVIRFLVEHARCPDCEGRFHFEDVHVLAADEQRIWDLAAVCHECQTLTLLRAVVSPLSADGTPTPGAGASVTELTPIERRRFAALAPIGEDDVLDVSAFLRDFDGDFGALFGTSPP